MHESYTQIQVPEHAGKIKVEIVDMKRSEQIGTLTLHFVSGGGLLQIEVDNGSNRVVTLDYYSPQSPTSKVMLSLERKPRA